MNRFRVLQFNMQFGQVWDARNPDEAPIDVQHAIDEILRHDADLITLQEVEQAAAGGHQRNPPPNFTRLQAALPGYDAYFSYPRADERELPFGIGLAMFCRTPLQNPWREELPSPHVTFEFFGETKTPTDRLMIGATTVLAGREVTLFNTHLLALFMLNSSSEIHGEQRARVGEHLREARRPTLLCGDFNVKNSASLVREYAALGFRPVQEARPTWRRQPYVLDHIFYNDAFRCVSHGVIPTPASDHHALRADFEFAG